MAKHKERHTFKVTQFQPNDSVTCSSIMVEVDGLKILFDLGLLQDSSLTFKQMYHINMQKLQSIPFDELDYVVISHAHYDHISALPILAREETGFNGTIITTELTAELGNLIMLDAQKINQSEVDKYSIIDKCKYRTFYDKEDVAHVMQEIHCYSYDKEIKLNDNVTLELLPASHLAGASMCYLTYRNEHTSKRLLFTGDFSYGHKIPKPFTKSVLEKTLKANVVICESTYGNKEKKASYKPTDNPLKFLEKIIKEEVVEKKQTLWLPSFAVHRATTLLYYLDLIDIDVPVYFCGQLMQQAHEVIGDARFRCYYDDEWNRYENRRIFEKEVNFLTTKQDVEHFCFNNTPKIVVSSSGMYDKGYSALLSTAYVGNKKVSTVSCGYMGEGTLGYQIKNKEAYVNVNGNKTKVRCVYLGTIPNLSGHANFNGLVGFIKSLNQSVLQEVILVHGDDESKNCLKEELEKEIKAKVVVPKQFQSMYCG